MVGRGGPAKATARDMRALQQSRLVVYRTTSNNISLGAPTSGSARYRGEQRRHQIARDYVEYISNRSYMSIRSVEGKGWLDGTKPTTRVTGTGAARVVLSVRVCTRYEREVSGERE